MSDSTQSFVDLKNRLDEIVETVADDTLPLEEVLDLYEEAVGIGLTASRIMEEGISAHDAETEAEIDQSAAHGLDEVLPDDAGNSTEAASGPSVGL